jgi:hypothetical protein
MSTATMTVRWVGRHYPQAGGPTTCSRLTTRSSVGVDGQTLDRPQLSTPRSAVSGQRKSPCNGRQLPSGGRPDSADRRLLHPRGEGVGGGLPADGGDAALTTLAMPRPMPPATAHRSVADHENRVSAGSNGETGAVSFRMARYPALISFSAATAPSMPEMLETSFHIPSRPNMSRTRRGITVRT